MNYYPFHIGDYRAATAHLSNDEDLAYRRLLEMYYDTEAPIPIETQWVARRLRLGCELIANVLQEFFYETPEGWKHARCEAEIAKYHKRCDANKANGNKGGRKPKTQSKPNRNPVGCESVANGFQTNNQEPNSKPPISPKGDGGGFDQFWLAYPKKVGKGAAEKAFAKARLNGHLPEVLKSIESQKRSEQWQKEGGQYIPNPATWLNQKRWEDGEPAKAEKDWI